MRSEELVGFLRTIGAWVVPALVILAWDVYQVPRLAGPMTDYHEQWVSRQIGGTGLRHLMLGLRRTGGANVRDVKQDGSLTLHTSYPPWRPGPLRRCWRRGFRSPWRPGSPPWSA